MEPLLNSPSVIEAVCFCDSVSWSRRKSDGTLGRASWCAGKRLDESSRPQTVRSDQTDPNDPHFSTHLPK